MKAYICDCCGKVCRQVMKFETDHNYYGSSGSWSNGLFSDNSELCNDCFAELNIAYGEIISKHRGLREHEKRELAYEQA